MSRLVSSIRDEGSEAFELPPPALRLQRESGRRRGDQIRMVANSLANPRRDRCAVVVDGHRIREETTKGRCCGDDERPARVDSVVR